MRQLGPLLCLLLLTACGQAGDLYLPDQSPPADQSGPESTSPPAADADASKDETTAPKKDAP